MCYMDQEVTEYISESHWIIIIELRCFLMGFAVINTRLNFIKCFCDLLVLVEYVDDTKMGKIAKNNGEKAVRE